MEMVFRKTECPCLKTLVGAVQNGEQTQELRVPDGLPDIGRILGAWGQAVLRGKEWRGDCVLVTGGVTAWVLYMGEEGTAPQSINTWIPFQLRWDLPEGAGEGQFRVEPRLRFVDARSVSPRKIMLRSGVACFGEATAQETVLVSNLECTGELELLQNRYPVRLPREVGEKSFQLDEEITLGTGKPLYYTLRPEITEQKVLTNKAAFRGNGNLHVLMQGENGSIQAQDIPLAFSQFVDLDFSYSQEAQVGVQLAVTDLELEEMESGSCSVKCGMLAQYQVDDMITIETVEDAYCPGREVTMELESLELPAVLERKVQTLSAEQTVPGSGSQMVDISFLPDFPRQYRENGAIALEEPGTMQLLYYGSDGSIQSTAARWEGKQTIPAGDSVKLTALPKGNGTPQVTFGGENINLRTEQPVQLTSVGGRGIPMVTDLKLGEPAEQDSGRPSLILRRAGTDSLWTIAKACGSTVSAIQKANKLTESPVPSQMLLIPVM